MGVTGHRAAPTDYISSYVVVPLVPSELPSALKRPKIEGGLFGRDRDGHPVPGLKQATDYSMKLGQYGWRCTRTEHCFVCHDFKMGVMVYMVRSTSTRTRPGYEKGGREGGVVLCVFCRVWPAVEAILSPTALPAAANQDTLLIWTGQTCSASRQHSYPQPISSRQPCLPGA